MQFKQVKTLFCRVHGLGEMEKEVFWIKTKSKFTGCLKKISAIYLKTPLSLLLALITGNLHPNIAQKSSLRLSENNCALLLNVIVRITHTQYQMHIKHYKDQQHFARKHWSTASRWRLVAVYYWFPHKCLFKEK